MKSFFSSHISRLSVLTTLCVLGVTTFSFPMMAVAKNACVRTSTGDVVCGELVPEQGSQSSKRLFVGTWEAQVPDNRWQMKVTWNSQANRYEGTLTKQGQASQYVGFSIGELAWTATIIDEHSMNVQQKYRWGSNGVSNKFQWVSGVVDLDQSTANSFTMALPPTLGASGATTSFIRVR